MNFIKFIFWEPVKKILGAFSKAYLISLKIILLNYLSYFYFTNSTNRMDKKIIKFFQHCKDLVFLEVGASNGIDCSNTLLLERKYKWTGFLIEPILNDFKICKKLRKKSYTSRNILVSNETFSKKKYLEIHPDYLQTSLSENITKSNENEFVETITLDDFFKLNGIKNIDIFILDVEGYEIEVLEGYNEKSKIIKYLLVESWNFKEFKEYSMKKGWSFLSQYGKDDYLFKL